MMPIRHLTLRIDLLGGAMTLSALGATLWCGLLKADSAAAELEQIRHHRIDMQTEHSRLQKTEEGVVAERVALEEIARREGHLVDPPPVQERLRLVRALFERHQWLDLQIMPQQWRSALDISEQSFSVSARAGFAQIMSLLNDFERGSDWADISHLTIRPLKTGPSTMDGAYQLDLTLNFYSSLHGGSQAESAPVTGTEGAP